MCPFSEHRDMSLRATNLGVELLDYRVCTHLPLLDTVLFSKWFYEGSMVYGAYEAKHSPFIVSLLPGSQWYYPAVSVCIFQVCIAGDACRDTHSSSVSAP